MDLQRSRKRERKRKPSHQWVLRRAASQRYEKLTLATTIGFSSFVRPVKRRRDDRNDRERHCERQRWWQSPLYWSASSCSILSKKKKQWKRRLSSHYSHWTVETVLDVHCTLYTVDCSIQCVATTMLDCIARILPYSWHISSFPSFDILLYLGCKSSKHHCCLGGLIFLSLPSPSLLILFP